MHRKTLLKLTGGTLLITLLFFISFGKSNARYVRSKKINTPRSHANFLPPIVDIDSSKMFPTSGNCKACHQYDETGETLVDAFGNDVNMYDDWAPTMMALSAKDPFWRAKVSHETHINPAHTEVLESTCTSCHAPMGHFTAFLQGATAYSIAEMLSDTTALDGVSCAVCHKISSLDIGDLNSGNIHFGTSRVIFGPYPGPFEDPMEINIGFTPDYGPHINDEGLCASCHTLLTNSVNTAGVPTGEKFVEQATYHEWLNSVYQENNTTCQSCHMPRLEEGVIIASGSKKIEERMPFALHDLVGANAFMQTLMKNNRDTLGISASVEAFDESLAKTYNMLKTQSLDIDLSFEESELDTATFTLSLHNKAGHKFPSGYPSRRAFVTFIVTTTAGDTLFASGLQDENYELIGHDSEYEPHYDVIRQENEVQIYQLVPVNVDGEFTTILEQAYMPIKDNRLPPVGFTTAHEVYDTTLIVGNALTDVDFNKDETQTEGTGTDLLHYKVALDGYTGNVNVSTSVFYQTLPPRWVKEMFEINTPEITLFKNMFEAADREPILIQSNNLTDIFVEGITAVEAIFADKIILYPNPVLANKLHISLPDDVTIEKINIFSIDGRLIKTIIGHQQEIEMTTKGLFIIEITTNKGVVLRKILLGMK